MKRLIGTFITIFLFSFGCASTKVTGIESKYDKLLGIKVRSPAPSPQYSVVSIWHPAFDDLDCEFINPNDLYYCDLYIGMLYEEFSDSVSVGLPQVDWKIDFQTKRSWKKDLYPSWLNHSIALEKKVLKKLGWPLDKFALSKMKTIGVKFSFSPSIPSFLFHFIGIELFDSDGLPFDSVTVLAAIYDLYASPTTGVNRFYANLVPFLLADSRNSNKFIYTERSNLSIFKSVKSIYELKNSGRVDAK